eukprot:CAMPEP_0113901952 /NCGR_PEP_ID=MMETSP0780_2-20120614/21557_1 /TAXON_ID=652834 /ORGANISM="Palpitomonas bilix" /LENGTH=472 /DNA_ID=CAMNT_0000894657 /DNA_START=250 /DNA_END=1665 /DNA_ORIENTATION=- /assembly_acc=CAM_ASM_000599
MSIQEEERERRPWHHNAEEPLEWIVTREKKKEERQVEFERGGVPLMTEGKTAWLAGKLASHQTPRDLPDLEVVDVPVQEGEWKYLRREAHQYPYCTAGQVKSSFGFFAKSGSGVLVGPRHVLTSSSLVFDVDAEVYVDTIQFCGVASSTHVVKYHVLKTELSESDGAKSECLALLFLEEPLGNEVGWMGIAYLPSRLLSKVVDPVVICRGQHGVSTCVLKPDDSLQSTHLQVSSMGESCQGGAVVVAREDEYFILGVLGECGEASTSSACFLRVDEQVLYRLHNLIEETQRVKDSPTTCVEMGEKLNLKDKRLSGGAAIVAILDFCSSHVLTALDLSGNNIGYVGTTTLLEVISYISTIASLNFDLNNVCPQGAKCFSTHLIQNSSLTVLYLNSNKIGDAGSSMLGEGLKSNSTLTKLHLGSNQIGDAGSSMLGEGLKSNSTLTELHLDSNQIGDAGSSMLGEGLKSNSTLT